MFKTLSVYLPINMTNYSYEEEYVRVREVMHRDPRSDNSHAVQALKTEDSWKEYVRNKMNSLIAI